MGSKWILNGSKWNPMGWSPLVTHTKNDGKSACFMGKSTLAMAIFNSKPLGYQTISKWSWWSWLCCSRLRRWPWRLPLSAHRLFSNDVIFEGGQLIGVRVVKVQSKGNQTGFVLTILDALWQPSVETLYSHQVPIVQVESNIIPLTVKKSKMLSHHIQNSGNSVPKL